MQADPGFVGLSGSAKDSVNLDTESGTNVNDQQWLLITASSAKARELNLFFIPSWPRIRARAKAEPAFSSISIS